MNTFTPTPRYWQPTDTQGHLMVARYHDLVHLLCTAEAYLETHPNVKDEEVGLDLSMEGALVSLVLPVNALIDLTGEALDAVRPTTRAGDFNGALQALQQAEWCVRALTKKTGLALDALHTPITYALLSPGETSDGAGLEA